jgi:hypothetical protein
MAERTSRPRTFNLKDVPYPQPLAQDGEQRREGDVEEEELRAAREWLGSKTRT